MVVSEHVHSISQIKLRQPYRYLQEVVRLVVYRDCKCRTVAAQSLFSASQGIKLGPLDIHLYECWGKGRQRFVNAKALNGRFAVPPPPREDTP